MSLSWDSAYTLELTNHTTNVTDEGTIWFSDSGAEEKVLERLEALEDQSLLSKPSSRILDLGTGNGHMLFELREEGWLGEMVGVDYSEASIELARRIGEARRKEAGAGEDAEEEDASKEGENEVQFETWNILTQPPGPWLGTKFDAVLDKGTFDAISLSAETDTQGRRICETYRDAVVPLIKENGFMVITSCNWTKEEVVAWFVADDGVLEVFDEARYPSFTFGGQTGQSVCTIVFRRR